jgi:dTDP-4-dehydrorhamnose 3,5-epimerase
MEIRELDITGVYEIVLKPIGDHRGFFMRTYDESIFRQNGLSTQWVQENHSFSAQKGTIRGLHFQFPPYSETKVVRCVYGEIMDVFVDLRRDSTTFGKWGSLILNPQKQNMVYIPRGFAHGFCTLSENTHILYKVDNVYSRESESGLLWNDDQLNIQWGIGNPIISEKDSKNLTFNEFVKKFKHIEI